MRCHSILICLLISIVVLLIVSVSNLLSSAGPPINVYAGADKCKSCHAKEYADWKESGHARILHRACDAENQAIPMPEGHERENISYVIGGFRWKALFLDQSGYLITGNGKNQYDVKSRKWADYLSGQKVPYDCGGCHTTGFSSEGHQDGLEGIRGTWKFEGVQCEVCHGPGALHSSSSLKADIKTDKNNCAKCHGTRPLEVIPLNGVFLASYTEANQLMKSKMKNLTCTDCHNPHQSTEKSIKQSCRSCHQKAATEYEGSYMYRIGVKCIDCHMPPAGIAAEGDKKTFQGDLRSHLFRIDHRKELPVAMADGKRINPGYLSVDYACTRCHYIFENRQWATSFAMYAHRIRVTTDIKIMRLQVVAASLGLLFSLAALLSAAFLKSWLGPPKDKKRMLSIHRHSAWITFSLYVFVSTMCIYFHFPLDKPGKALNMGWFLIHIFNGPLGLFIYAGKIIAVRKYKKGWGAQGVLWGAALFIFWLVQYGTAIFSFYKI